MQSCDDEHGGFLILPAVRLSRISLPRGGEYLHEVTAGSITRIDREHKEWHSGVTDELEHVGRKGAVYKSAYHNGRALIECIEAIDRF